MLKSLFTNGGWVIVLLSICQVSCRSYAQPDGGNADTLRLPVLTLDQRDTVIQTPYVADIQAIKNVEIRARVKGFLESIFVDEGKPVRKGQPLFKINDEEYTVNLSKAKAALSNALAAAKSSEVEAGRVKLLVDKHVVAASELDLALARVAADKATIEEARAAVQSAENHLSYTLIRAPFDGLLDRIPLKAGSLIDEGTLLTSLSDISSMYAYFSIPENEYLRLQKSGDGGSGDVQLVLADGSNYPYHGKIETVEGEIEQNTGSIDFRARIPNPQRLLRHGATGKLYISRRVDSVLVVPQRSVFDIQDKSYVYVVGKGDVLQMRNIVPLTRLTGCYLVREGLQPDERILYEGAQNVRAGMTIHPRPVKN
ncbi:MAG TPA: efflux RND transporter periplasmic adaptor subunit [Puia sp.]|uniref:efflux RND transporter periplasmic adaptor subunit n=1 Tax=Puia sp. TaxID=2045100 RepID=UPI002C795FBD|nr:efflux RND transporter periplasmic adaptor subunit [Puia sp.]HVU98228.1 efflux RND transporter periplasmic adaptor subunit [Puia sp.]